MERNHNEVMHISQFVWMSRSWCISMQITDKHPVQIYLDSPIYGERNNMGQSLIIKTVNSNAPLS